MISWLWNTCFTCLRHRSSLLLRVCLATRKTPEMACSEQILSLPNKVLVRLTVNQSIFFFSSYNVCSFYSNRQSVSLSQCSIYPSFFTLHSQYKTFFLSYVAIPSNSTPIHYTVDCKSFPLQCSPVIQYILFGYFQCIFKRTWTIQRKGSFSIFRSPGYFPKQREVYQCFDEHTERNSHSALLQGYSNGRVWVWPW